MLDLLDLLDFSVVRHFWARHHQARLIGRLLNDTAMEFLVRLHLLLGMRTADRYRGFYRVHSYGQPTHHILASL
jgi:hypothetical protein